MPDTFDDDLDRWALEHDDEELSSNSTPTPDESDGPDNADAISALEAIVAAGGAEGRLAAELLAAMEDRAASEALAATRQEAREDAEGLRYGELVDAVDQLRAGGADTPTLAEAERRLALVNEALRNHVIKEQERADERLLMQFARLYRQEGLTDFDSQIAEDRARLAQMRAEAVADPESLLREHPEVRAYWTERGQKERARALLEQEAISADDHWERLLENERADQEADYARQLEALR